MVQKCTWQRCCPSFVQLQVHICNHERVIDGLGGVQFYFSSPHHPWQQGTNENTNELLRKYFPEGQDLSEVTQEAVQHVEDELNHRLRKILGYKTPAEIHFFSEFAPTPYFSIELI